MGVPKFFRYISERYPCLSEVVREHQIPEFDNLYLDMNGIIHVCSHPNDNDPHFRISEESIFSDIFHYIETLFRLIQPKRLFFMAIDGVAPRAKMNQQRGRRFRTAKDATVQEAKARANNEVLPDAERFDSNCITPGTVFMSRLHAQLRYIVSCKISTDKLWQKPTIILSGHETPGEGEHKIMDYIRYMKSQPDYDPNTRHCLYGLDADLIMLGLCTHEPHFSLLREEVKFGRSAKNKVRASVPEEIRFYLLHLSLMREYLELEFQELKTTLPFPFNVENIIDDWVMMGFLVGNDFIPHLPNLHIANGALPILYKAYKDILPTVGGYINEGGTLNLPRFQKYMEKLAGFDLSRFKDTYADLKYFQMKTGRRPDEKERTSYKNEENGKSDIVNPVKDAGLAALIQSTDNMLLDDARDGDTFYSTDEDDDDAMMFAEFYQHKNDYYVNKLEYTKVTDEVLQSQAEGYVRAIQWNLNYYYNGCCSWSWFYPHHYAPFISDIKNFKNLKLEFDAGEPFLPFQQLLAVLPSGSKKLLPEPFQELMVNEDSPIIDFYPTDFKTDMNGKKQEWEAVVLIPFINQDALLKAMATKYDRLTDEEKRRNSHGPMLVYNYTPENQGIYEAPEYYPALNRCYAKEVPLSRESIFVEQSKLVKGLCPNVRLDVYFPGFPTLNHLRYTAELRKGKVKVFNQPSLGDNMILTLNDNPDFSGPLLTVATNIIDKTVFVNWPHLAEAKVVAVADEKKRIVIKHCADGSSTLVTEDLSHDLTQQWCLSKKGIEETYFSKMGVDCKNTEILVYACNLEGRKYVFTNNGRVSYEKKWTKLPSSYAAQTLVRDIAVNEPEFTDHLTLNDVFKPSSICFTLGTPHYGAMGVVRGAVKNGKIKLDVCITSEPDLEPAIRAAHQCRSSYIPGYIMSQRLGISSHLLSRLTGSIFIVDGERGGCGGAEHPHKTNIGLNLKFTKKNEEVCGYTRKENGQWLYSAKAEQLINDYMKFAPALISYIATNVGGDIYYVNEIFPENSAEEMKKLTTWLSEQDFIKAERLPCGCEVLQEEVVSVIEKIVDFTENKTARSVVMQIKPYLLLIPKANVTGLCPDSSAVHKVFDRIICVRESFTVPLGMKGTIIGIQSTAENDDDVIYDVVFDQEFAGGIKIRCSSNRGYKMTRKGFLNLSYGVRLENNKVKNSVSYNPVHQSEYDRFDSSASYDNQRSSAFASCNIKGNQTNRQQDGSSVPVQQFHKQKLQLSDSYMPTVFTKNSDKERKVQGAANELDLNKPSSEFETMWNELKKAGTKPLSQGGQAAPPSGDAADVLKKMLKIADTSPKRKLNSNNSLPSSREVDKDVSKSITCSSSIQLENLIYARGGGKPVYMYESSDSNGKTYIVAKVYCDIPPDLEKSFTGTPSLDRKSAMESAAVAALHGLKSEDQSGIESLLKTSTSTGHSNNSTTKRPLYPANSYGLQNQVSSPQLPLPAPLLGYNHSIRQQSRSFPHHQQYRSNSSNSGHGMNNSFNNWFNTDLPTPPQQWYQNSSSPHQNTDGRHLDWKQRQDSKCGNGGIGSKQHYQPQQYYSPSQHQHVPPQSYQNVSFQQSNVPNLRHIHPIPSLVGQPLFIPLQAITQCRTTPSSCSNFIPMATNSSSPMQQRSEQTVIDSSITNNVSSGANQSRPSTVLGQPRRSRVAANFNVKLD